MPELNFTAFVISLATTAAMHLGDIADPQTGQAVPVNLEGAGQMIDILALHAETGDFGELVYAGMDWVDKKLANRSMELLATEVMPRVKKALGK